MKPYRAVLAVVLALVLGWASVGYAGGRGGGPRSGGGGFHGGGGSHGGRGLHGGRGNFHGGRLHGGHGGGRFHGAPGRSRGGRFHGHHGFRGQAFVGVAPLFLWGPSFVYTPPVVVDPPPVYVQPPPSAYWYYCPSAGAYYPYVASCPEAWVPVPAR